MPKSKKPKVVSLVVYGGESDSAESGNEKEDEVEENEETESDESNESDVAESGGEEHDRKGTKRTRETSDFSDDNEMTGDVRSETQSSEEFKSKKKQKQIINEKETNIEIELDDQISNESSSSTRISTKQTQLTLTTETTSNQIDLTDETQQVVQRIDTDSPKSNPHETLDLSSKLTKERGFPSDCSNIRLPPPPKASCSQTLQNKIIQVVERMNKYKYNINEDIHNKKSFKNPCIYEKLIASHGIDEYGSSFPTHIEDLKSNGYSFYDELDNIQKADWAKKERERKERTKIEMVSGTKKPSK